MQILIAEQDRALGLFLKQGLELDGHQVECLPDGAGAAAAFRASPRDLVVLDLLPGENGVLDQIRSIDGGVPVLVLTARREIEERVVALDGGADDCMIKPLSLQEFRARCRALLRRRRPASSLVLRSAGIELNRVSHSVMCEGRPVPLTNKEFALLEYLMMHGGSCVSRAALLAEVWNGEASSGTNVVDVYINYLRRKLEAANAPAMIQTVRGQGYLVASHSVAMAHA